MDELLVFAIGWCLGIGWMLLWNEVERRSALPKCAMCKKSLTNEFRTLTWTLDGGVSVSRSYHPACVPTIEVGKGEPFDGCTCNDCPSAKDECEYAYDRYNTRGDCLAEK